MTKNDVFAVFKIQQVMQGSRGGEKWEIEATKGKSYLPAKIHFVALVSGQLACCAGQWSIGHERYFQMAVIAEKLSSLTPPNEVAPLWWAA